MWQIRGAAREKGTEGEEAETGEEEECEWWLSEVEDEEGGT